MNMFVDMILKLLQEHYKMFRNDLFWLKNTDAYGITNLGKYFLRCTWTILLPNYFTTY